MSDPTPLEVARASMAKRLGRSDARLVVSPYRICPIGAHIDHQGGPVLGTAISAHTLLLFAPRDDDQCRIVSENYAGEVHFSLGETRETTPGADIGGPDWGRYAVGVAALLSAELPADARGFDACVMGTLPGGGLSSSASVDLAYATALAAVNDLTLDPVELALLAQHVENEWIGVACGALDPISIVGSKRDHILAIDTRAPDWEAIPLPTRSPDARWVVAYTGVERKLTGTHFNARVEDLRKAARTLSRMAGLAGLAEISILGDLPEEALDAHLEELEEPLRRRARHFRDERERVREGARRWREGDLESFGALMNASCDSSRVNYESGSAELIHLQRVFSSTPGVLGSRFSGGGFGGCSVALVLADRAEAVCAEVEAEFRDAHPQLASAARCFLVESDDGVRVE